MPGKVKLSFRSHELRGEMKFPRANKRMNHATVTL